MFLHKRGLKMTDEAKLKVPFLAKASSDKVYCYIVMALMLFLPVAEIITEVLGKNKVKIGGKFLYPSYYQPYIVGVFGGILALVIILNVISRIVNGKFKLYVADIFFVTFMTFMLLSMACSMNPGVFADGQKHYCERPEIFLCYYGLYFAGSMIEDPKLRKKILITYFFVALMQGVVAFLQTYQIEIYYCLFYNYRVSRRSAYGLVQNTNFYGTLSCLLTTAVSGLFVFSSKLFKNRYIKWIFFAVALFVFYTMLASNARLAWLGFAGMICTYIVSLIVMHKSNMDKESLKKITFDFLIMLAGFIFVIVITTLFTTYITGRVKESKKDVVQSVGSDDFGHGRGKIWKTEIECIKHHWVTGIGLDNLAEAFREMPGWQKGDYVQQKGHNEYLHLAATQGIFALTNYLAALIYALVNTVKKILKEEDDTKRCIRWILLTMFAAYVCQAMLSSSIMNVAPYFWLVLGLLSPRTKPITFKKKG